MLRVVGTAIFPALGDSTQLGNGAEITVDGLRGLVPAGVQLLPYTGLMIKFRSGVSPQAGLSSSSPWSPRARAGRRDSGGPGDVRCGRPVEELRAE